ncbi:SRPBCC family protein [Methylobacterium haplocladii]|uniref:MxaD protein n=1 Tax=Methylobacterium haplocladii TaxID=1176176 RepID=A0A512IUA0_9HYPH|nr:SRPBCC family protein [Methylobacterium haplocladii]GEP01219.1 hypothetical protein MHA02_36060 [Methylobacterium haplocladii]GJD86308.1 hypothetical protein HPGCJGGD_4213 [Methylobacterium haplocladii]GLS60818.1 hypothetical protein GCM10007887_35060 [Methylobacterium haplocladii]
MRFVTPTIVFALTATSALAHGPTPQKVDQSITIKAKPDAVWKVVGDFSGIKAWHPALEKSEGDKGSKDGGTRTLTFKNGGVLKESLDEYKAEGFTYSYRSGDADLKALPVSSYSATLTVSPDGEGSKVEWIGRFYRGDTGNEPPENLSDEAGKTAMNAFFGDGLKGLKGKVEGAATQ